MTAFNRAEFAISYPVWFVASDPQHQTEWPSLDSVCRLDSPAGETVAVFTDRSLAERHMETELRTQGMKPVPIESPYLLARALVSLLSLGVTHVGFDPTPSDVVQFPVPDVIAALRSAGQ